MRTFLICDNEDTAVGLRLAGIESAVTDSPSEAERILCEISAEDDIGLILINRSLGKRIAGAISEFRNSHFIPVLTEIPDRNSDNTENSIADYVRESIGIKI